VPPRQSAVNLLEFSMLDRHVNGQRILRVVRLAAILTLVEEQRGKMDALHVVEHVALLRVGLAAQVAHVLGIIVVGTAHQCDVVHQIFAVADNRR